MALATDVGRSPMDLESRARGEIESRPAWIRDVRPSAGASLRRSPCSDPHEPALHPWRRAGARKGPGRRRSDRRDHGASLVAIFGMLVLTVDVGGLLLRDIDRWSTVPTPPRSRTEVLRQRRGHVHAPEPGRHLCRSRRRGSGRRKRRRHRHRGVRRWPWVRDGAVFDSAGGVLRRRPGARRRGGR